MAYEKIVQDNQNLVKFWDQVFTELPEKETELTEDEDSFKELAPSEKLFEAACTLGHKTKVLDFGCGTAWASIIAAKSGCKDVTAVDAAPGAVKAAQTYSSRYGMESSIHLACGGLDFLQSVPSDTYDGIICSNVLDVIPTETADQIIREFARIATANVCVFIGMNYYLSPDMADKRGLTLEDGNRLYVDGVLRLVSRSDEEWEQLFSHCFAVVKREYFAWPGEEKPTRRLFCLQKKEEQNKEV